MEKIIESLLKSAKRLLFEIGSEKTNITEQLSFLNKDEDIDLIKSFGTLKNEQIIS